MLTVYGIRNCDTMKKACAWLDASGVAYAFVDYKKAGVVAARLPDWARRAGWQALLNTRGLTWRRLSEDERAGLDEAKALALMAEHPTLIRRPLIEASQLGEELLLGFDAERYRQRLLAKETP